MLNSIWIALILISLLWAAYHPGQIEGVGTAVLEAPRQAVELVLKLAGGMAFFLGLMRVAQQGGLLYWMTRAMAPLLRRLFPEVPPDHPAMGAIVMNLASNALGLGNAATPFGLKAMVELERLNPRPGTASDAMVLFLAINASSVALFPTGVIILRESLGSAAPTAIWLPTLVATAASTSVAVAAALVLRKLPTFRRHPTAAVPSPPPPPAADEDGGPSLPTRPPAMSPWRRATVLALALALAFAAGRSLLHTLASTEGDVSAAMSAFSEQWFLPLFVAALLLFGIAGRVRAYEVAVEGAKEGLSVALRIVPFLVLILTAVAMLRASGALEAAISALQPLTGAVGIPADALPMALLRPLSGSGAYSVLVETMETVGPDSFTGYLVSTLQGSTETTFYVLTIYLGAARIRDARHALPTCLCGDLAGLFAATAICHLTLG